MTIGLRTDHNTGIGETVEEEEEEEKRADYEIRDVSRYLYFYRTATFLGAQLI